MAKYFLHTIRSYKRKGKTQIEKMGRTENEGEKSCRSLSKTSLVRKELRP